MSGVRSALTKQPTVGFAVGPKRKRKHFREHMNACWDKYGKEAVDATFHDLEADGAMAEAISNDAFRDKATKVAKKVATKYGLVEKDFLQDFLELHALSEERAGMASESSDELLSTLYERCYDPSFEQFDLNLFLSVVQELGDGRNGPRTTGDLLTVMQKLRIDVTGGGGGKSPSHCTCRITFIQFASLVQHFVHGLRFKAVTPAHAGAATAAGGEVALGSFPKLATPKEASEASGSSRGSPAQKGSSSAEDLWATLQSDLAEMNEMKGELPEGCLESLQRLAKNFRTFVLRYAQEQKTQIFHNRVVMAHALERSKQTVDDLTARLDSREGLLERILKRDHKLTHEVQSLQKSCRDLKRTYEGRLNQLNIELDGLRERNKRLGQELEQMILKETTGPQTDFEPLAPRAPTSKEMTQLQEKLHHAEDELAKARKEITSLQKHIEQGREGDVPGGMGGTMAPKTPRGGPTRESVSTPTKQSKNELSDQVDVMLKKMDVLMQGDEQSIQNLFKGSYFQPSLATELDRAVHDSSDEEELEGIPEGDEEGGEIGEIGGLAKELQDAAVRRDSDASSAFAGAPATRMAAGLLRSDMSVSQMHLKSSTSLHADGFNLDEINEDLEQMILQRVNLAENNLMDFQGAFMKEIEAAKEASTRIRDLESSLEELREENDRLQKERDDWRVKAERRAATSAAQANSKAAGGGDVAAAYSYPGTLAELTADLPPLDVAHEPPAASIRANKGRSTFVAEGVKSAQRYEAMQRGCYVMKIGPNVRSRLKAIRAFTRNKRFIWLSEDYRYVYWSNDPKAKDFYAIRDDKEEPVDDTGAGVLQSLQRASSIITGGGPKFIPLEAVTRFEYGENSRAFRLQEFRSDRDSPHLCFSVYTVARSLDFVASAEKDIETWVVGLSSLIPYQPGREFYTIDELRLKKCLLKMEYTNAGVAACSINQTDPPSAAHPAPPTATAAAGGPARPQVPPMKPLPKSGGNAQKSQGGGDSPGRHAKESPGRGGAKDSPGRAKKESPRRHK
ncbi:unnamed protein product [Vitrella brassicaformis CCMP3155]|uniref:PH domain-containing protein n=3 Tax=Vitrella brassicaformis TaxID=1169539 RepID=A0A0G4F4Z9_VITBC|nr:unnamed protein product [Vitrella brassicaformis CCMP3155]|eukprot:CEM06792.1 unnamed protein product [Vitrella brassicaformis CCMP3155]